MMLKFYPLGFLIALSSVLMTCIPKTRYYESQARFRDSIQVLKHHLRASENDNQELYQLLSRYRVQAKQQKQYIRLYQDSLQSLQYLEKLSHSDSSFLRNLVAQNQDLNQANTQLEAQLEKSHKQAQYYQGLQAYYQNKLTQAEDSLGLLHSLIESSYTSPYNYPKQLHLFENTFDCYIVNLQKSKLQFFWKNSRGEQYRNIRSLLQDLRKDNQTLLFATNAGMYTSANSPQGLYIEKGKELKAIDLKKEGYGNFYMQPNGVFLIDQEGKAQIIPSKDFKKQALTSFATQSGPLLLLNGQINQFFTPGSKNKFIRSGVGKISPNQIVFIISRKPVNFYDFARLFKDYFQCQEALYLDGAISKMFLPEIGRFDLGGDFGPLIGIIK